MSTAPARTRVQPATEVALRKALATGTRPSRAGALSAVLAFGWRGMLKIKHVPEQLIDVTLTPVLFVLMFTFMFGGAIAGSTGEYLQFLLPGVLVMSVLFTTVYSGVALNTDVTKGVVDRFRSLPIWRPSPLIGAVLGDSVRYLVAATVIIVLGVALGYRPEAGAVGVAAAAALVIGVRRRRRLLEPLRGRDTLGWRAGFSGGLAGTAVGALANDSGPMILLLGTLALMLAVGYVHGRPRFGPAPAAPLPEPDHSRAQAGVV